MLLSSAVGNANRIGAFGTAAWMMYVMLSRGGWLSSVVAFVVLSFSYKFGTAPLFMVAASYLSFGLNAVGVWLPILSYVLGAIDLTIAFRLYREAKNLAE